MKRFLIIATILPACLLGCGRAGVLSDDPQALVKSGWDNYILGEYDTAVVDFDRAAGLAEPGSDIQLQALFGQATTYDLRRPAQNRSLAQETYKKVVELAPQSMWAAWSLLGLARMEHLAPVGQKVDWDKVRAMYEEVYTRFPDQLPGQEAFCYEQETRLLERTKENATLAADALNAFAKQHPDSPYLNQAYYLLGEAYAILDRPKDRLQAEIRRVECYEADPFGVADHSGDYWRIASIAQYTVGDFKTARIYYQRLIDEYPTNRLVFSAKLALKGMDAIEAKIRNQLASADTPQRSGDAS